MDGHGLAASRAATVFENFWPLLRRYGRTADDLLHDVLCGWVDQDLAFDLSGGQAIQFGSEAVEG